MAHFDGQWLLVNHRATPLELEAAASRSHHALQPCAPGCLAGHSAFVVDS